MCGGRRGESCAGGERLAREGKGKGFPLKTVDTVRNRETLCKHRQIDDLGSHIFEWDHCEEGVRHHR